MRRPLLQLDVINIEKENRADGSQPASSTRLIGGLRGWWSGPDT